MICAICLESDGPFLSLPCCHRENSTTQYCWKCLDTICSQSQRGVGKCPTCRTSFGFDPTKVAVPVKKPVAYCRICRLQKTLFDVNTLLCEICHIGSRTPLRYECSRCHRVQRILQPMYRHQSQPGAFTSARLPCSVGCGNHYTQWRIVPDDLRFISSENAPAAWGALRDRWLEGTDYSQMVLSSVDSLSLSTSATPATAAVAAERDGTSTFSPLLVLDSPQSAEQRVGRCRMCSQQSMLIDSGAALCEICHFGSKRCLRYECGRCHRVQRIAQPMYRHQSQPGAFTSARLPCSVGCGNHYTQWRIVMGDLRFIGEEDAPADWGTRRERWVESLGIGRRTCPLRSGARTAESNPEILGASSSAFRRMVPLISVCDARYQQQDEDMDVENI